MKTIWKFPVAITDKQVVHMPEGAEILTAQFQRDTLCLWALVEDMSITEPRLIEILGTGHDIADAERKHIATVQQLDTMVWHVFESF